MSPLLILGSLLVGSILLPLLFICLFDNRALRKKLKKVQSEIGQMRLKSGQRIQTAIAKLLVERLVAMSEYHEAEFSLGHISKPDAQVELIDPEVGEQILKVLAAFNFIVYDPTSQTGSINRQQGEALDLYFLVATAS